MAFVASPIHFAWILQQLEMRSPRPGANGQTEGQINRLKTLKRSMYGRAGIDLLRARMIPIRPGQNHTD
jgi:hypothetical protein